MASRALFSAARRAGTASAFRSFQGAARGAYASQLRPIASLASASHTAYNTDSAQQSAVSHRAALLTAFAAGAAALAAPQTAHSDAAAVPLATDLLSDAIDLTPLSRVEADTAVTFPTAVSSAQKLLGLGCRHMRGIVKVYALGVYLDPAKLPAVLAPWASFAPAELVAAPPVWRALCEPSVQKTLRLVVVRDVPGYHMCNGFERALLPRVKARAETLGGTPPREVQATARRFCKWFKEVGNMKIGSVVLISVRDGRAELTVDGRYMGTVEDVCLAWALADMFLGDDGVIPPLRADVAEGLSEVLKGTRK